MLLAPTISQPQSGSVFRPASEHLSLPQKGFVNGVTGTNCTKGEKARFCANNLFGPGSLPHPHGLLALTRDCDEFAKAIDTDSAHCEIITDD